MIVWRGAGIIVALSIFGCSLVGNLLSDALAGKGYWEVHSWPFACAMIAAGAMISLVDLYLSKRPERVLRDEATGQRVTLTSKRDFFFVPMKYWGPIAALIGVAMLAFGVTPGKI